MADRVSLRFVVTFVLIVAAAGPALAADCGGATPCSCGDTVVASRTLVSGVDPVLTTRCPCNGLEVASGVTLDVGGTITGEGVCSGIFVQDDAAGVVITHGRVTGFFIGVNGSAGTATNVTVSRMQVLGNADTGIQLAGSDLVIEHNVVRGSQFGIGFFASGTVRSNKVEGNHHGIIVSGQTVRVANNVAIRNRGRGIDVDGVFDAPDVTLIQNRADSNGAHGFGIFGEGVHAIRNISTRNGRNESEELRHGFTVQCTACELVRNISSYNGGFGILDDSTFKETNTYTDNRCVGNALGASDPPGLCRR